MGRWPVSGFDPDYLFAASSSSGPSSNAPDSMSRSSPPCSLSRPGQPHLLTILPSGFWAGVRGWWHCGHRIRRNFDIPDPSRPAGRYRCQSRLSALGHIFARRRGVQQDMLVPPILPNSGRSRARGASDEGADSIARRAVIDPAACRGESDGPYAERDAGGFSCCGPQFAR